MCTNWKQSSNLKAGRGSRHRRLRDIHNFGGKNCNCLSRRAAPLNLSTAPVKQFMGLGKLIEGAQGVSLHAEPFRIVSGETCSAGRRSLTGLPRECFINTPRVAASRADRVSQPARSDTCIARKKDKIASALAVIKPTITITAAFAPAAIQPSAYTR